jgi:hypothetical protein
MSFTWWEPKRPRPVPGRREAMYRRELEERARLLCRLGYPAKQAKARLSAYVAWDFDPFGLPRHAGDVDRIVDAAYQRQSPR